MTRRRSLLPQAAAILLLLMADRARAAESSPRIDPAERTLVAATRTGAEAQCDCGTAPTHRAYLRCVSRAVKALAAGRLSKGGMHEAMRCAARSTCGREGMATCCRTSRSARTRCAIVPAAKCVAPPGGSACVSSFASWCDAVDQGCTPLQTPHDINCCLPPTSSGGAFVCEPQKPSECSAAGGTDMGSDGSCVPDPCGGVTTTTTTSTVPPLCGNGMIDPGEQCDPPWSRTCPARGPGHINRECQDDCTCPTAPTTTSSTVLSTTTTETVPTTTVTITTTSTSIVETTTSTSITTSTTAGCSCCTATGRLAFTTGAPTVGGGGCGSVLDDAGTKLLPLDCGGLYFGGAGVGVPPSVIPDTATSFTNITNCDAASGNLTLSATTATDTGSNRDCTAAGGTNPEYPGKPGCLFGPPLPIPNPNSPATSTCVVNRVSTSASGTANCKDGSVSVLNIPLLSDIYLTGPTEGVIPCPRCAATPGPGTTCQAGPNAGQPCTPVGSAILGAASPTSHDCPPAAASFIGSLPIPFALSTGTQTKMSADLPAQPFVFCGFCGQRFSPTFQGPPARPCTTDSQCTTAPFTTCRQRTSGAFAQGPARTITETGSPAGACISDGAVRASTLVSVFCIPPAYNATVDAAGDLPGPGAVALPGQAQFVP
jgi:hypothetical protein